MWSNYLFGQQFLEYALCLVHRCLRRTLVTYYPPANCQMMLFGFYISWALWVVLFAVPEKFPTGGRVTRTSSVSWTDGIRGRQPTLRCRAKRQLSACAHF